MQFTLEEDDDTRYVFSPGTELCPNLVTKVEKSQENIQNMRFDELLSRHSNEVCLRTWLQVGIIPN